MFATFCGPFRRPEKPEIQERTAHIGRTKVGTAQAMMDTVAEFGIGVVLFVLGYRGYVGKWPWDRKP